MIERSREDKIIEAEHRIATILQDEDWRYSSPPDLYVELEKANFVTPLTYDGMSKLMSSMRYMIDKSRPIRDHLPFYSLHRRTRMAEVLAKNALVMGDCFTADAAAQWIFDSPFCSYPKVDAIRKDIEHILYTDIHPLAS